MTFPVPSVRPGGRIKSMTAIPLIIEDASDVRLVSSGLALHNNEVIEESLKRNRTNREVRQRESKKALHEESLIGAEFITRKRDSTRTVKLEEVAHYYKPNK